MRVLVVEDPPEWAESVSNHIAGLGRGVHVCGTVQDALAHIRQSPPGILVTAASLPDGDMLGHIAPLRRTFPAMGIIVLTDNVRMPAQLQSLSDGADHYLIKPIQLALLAVTVSALERRLVTATPGPISHCNWTLDVQSRQLRSSDGQQLSLTAKESIVMATLIQSPKYPVSHKRMSQNLGYPAVIYDQHRIDALLYRVRKKLATLRDAPLQIRNIYSEGSLLVLREGRIGIATHD
ncbi:MULTISPECIES: response regulator transcription factor [Achromobacter]|uniref:response regulator transcription factor n=1 Tax=Achromobacter TaxID=222 RepID=UPI0006BFF5CD|nr:response regulator [Achromobacter dolens]MBQ2648254.1 response regulator transcription factor [Achromobacter sp.]OAS91982.1 transcriptional regulator [Achromobacter xylosoxidans]CUJ54216.1 Transcriptional regulatory protein phoP [Achromobacter dolens]